MKSVIVDGWYQDVNKSDEYIGMDIKKAYFVM